MFPRSALTAAAVVCFAASLAAGQWPAFRGEHARGVTDASPPVTWNASTGNGVRWRVPIPGLSHASPIVWNDRVYVLSAVAAGSTLDRTAQGVVFATDTVTHEWRLYCLDASGGATRWVRAVHTGAPKQARHVRGTYANATPATNGRVIVASLGNEGLFGFDMDGTRLWRVEMTPPQPDASLDPASSPVIAGDVVIVQNDWKQGGFAAAYDLATGRERWRIARSEGLSWSTPGLWATADGSTQVVFNSARWIRAHDAANGRALWSLNNTVESPWDRVPTPVPFGDMLLVGGGGAQGPVLAVRSTAAGELRADPASTPAIAWRVERGAPYLPTPLVYRGLVYVVADNGVVSVYRDRDGSLVHRTRVAADAGTISASPVGAGGRVYVSSQDGDIFVIGAGETFALLARNPMGEPIFATPAIAGDLLIVRTAAGVYGLAAALPTPVESGAPFTDARDGKTYPVVNIAGMTWMARNLDHAIAGSVCPRGDEQACDAEGRLYPWAAAVGACPAGWHLSTEDDWQQLERTLGVSAADLARDRERGPGLGDRLKQGGSTGLNFPLAGWRRPDGTYRTGNGTDRAAAIWTSTRIGDDAAWHRDLSSARSGIWRSAVPLAYSLSVRCVKDGMAGW